MQTNNVPQQKKPLYNVGDKVNTPKNLYKETEGEITEIERLYKEVDENGRFVCDGLVTAEGTIQSIVLPHTFDGQTLVVNHPETDYGSFVRKAFVMTSKFYGYAYTVKSTKILTIWNEKRIRLQQPAKKAS